MKYFAQFKDDGFPDAFYSDAIHGDQIPEDSIQINEEQWREMIEYPGLRKWVDGEVVEYVPPPHLPPITVVNSVDLWSRMTDDEADQVGNAMATQSFRIRKIFETATTYRADHELWPLLEETAKSLFGEERANEIFAPSN